jgi:hypothetical protein
VLTGAPANLTYLQAWRSRMQTGRDANLDEYYLRQKDVPVSADGTVQLTTVLPGELWTLSTGGLGASVKGSHPPSPPLSPFPVQYSDDFDRCPRYQEPDYWTDQTGSWECVNATASATRGMVMRQSVPAKPVAWRPDEQRPMSIIGATQPIYDPQHRMQICAAAHANSCTLSFICLTACVYCGTQNNAGNINWSGIVLGIDVLLPKPGDGAMLGVRANPNCCGRLITGEDLLPGLCASHWWLLYPSWC